METIDELGFIRNKIDFETRLDSEGRLPRSNQRGIGEEGVDMLI